MKLVDNATEDCPNVHEITSLQ